MSHHQLHHTSYPFASHVQTQVTLEVLYVTDSTRVSPALQQQLIECAAESEGSLAASIREGNLPHLKALLEAGAAVHFKEVYPLEAMMDYRFLDRRREDGNTAALDAKHGAAAAAAWSR